MQAKCTQQESNLHRWFRKPLFYPLNYGCFSEVSQRISESAISSRRIQKTQDEKTQDSKRRLSGLQIGGFRLMIPEDSNKCHEQQEAAPHGRSHALEGAIKVLGKRGGHDDDTGKETRPDPAAAL